MIIDNNLVFADGQTPPSPVSADFVSTNVIDTEVATSNQGAGTPIWVVVILNNSQSGTTAETLSVELQDCATSGGTYATLLEGATFSGGELTAGLHLLVTPIPMKHKRYLRVLYDCSAGLVWTGTIDAYLTAAAPRN